MLYVLCYILYVLCYMLYAICSATNLNVLQGYVFPLGTSVCSKLGSEFSDGLKYGYDSANGSIYGHLKMEATDITSPSQL